METTTYAILAIIVIAVLITVVLHLPDSKDNDLDIESFTLFEDKGNLTVFFKSNITDFSQLFFGLNSYWKGSDLYYDILTKDGKLHKHTYMYFGFNRVTDSFLEGFLSSYVNNTGDYNFKLFTTKITVKNNKLRNRLMTIIDGFNKPK